MSTFTKIGYDEHTQVTWYNISGIDYRTDYNFGQDGECFGVTVDNKILDIDGELMIEDDFENMIADSFVTIAVRNTLGI